MLSKRHVVRLSAGAAALSLFAISGCRATAKPSEGDRLRRQVLEQERALSRLAAERDELAAKLAEIERVRLTGGEVSAEVLAAMPRCAAISIGALSGLVDADNSPGFDAVDVTVVPTDGRQRFVQVAGRLTARADLTPPPSSGGDAGGVALATASLTPADLREAYRSSFMGTHYAVRMPISQPNRPLEGTLVISIEFLDGLTGRVHEAQVASPIPPPSPSRR